jgi:hypothetical protein
MSVSVSSAGSLGSASENSEVTKSVISASDNNKADDESNKSKEEVVDMSQSMGLRNRHYNKDVKYHQKRNQGNIPIFTQVQINEMRRVISKKNMQLMKHHELHPIWVRMGMEGKYPKEQNRLVIVAKMKQFAVLNLEIVSLTNDFANAWVSSS